MDKGKYVRAFAAHRNRAWTLPDPEQGQSNLDGHLDTPPDPVRDQLLEAAKNLLLTFDSYGKERLPEYVRKEFAPLIAAVRKAEGGDA